ncbi:MAG: diguanylate cyclase [Nitrospiria bacterium]
MKPTILLIEESKIHAKTLLNLLEEFGFSTLHASNGLDGLNLAFSKKPDMILLDIVLPQIGGLEVCKLLKLNNESQKIPIIILTQKRKPENKVAGLNMGANDYLTKPYHPEELKARILANLRSKEKQDLLEKENRRIETLLDKIQVLASQDPLTTLLNRKQFMLQLKTEFIRSTRYHLPLSVCFIDLDHLKTVNHLFGQTAGDTILVETAALIQESFREIDILSRFENDDFLLGLPHSSPEDALVPPNRFQKKIAQHPFKSLPPELKVTVSIGVAALPNPGLRNEDDFVETVRKAVCQCKEKGGNQISIWKEHKTSEEKKEEKTGDEKNN